MTSRPGLCLHSRRLPGVAGLRERSPLGRTCYCEQSTGPSPPRGPRGPGRCQRALQARLRLRNKTKYQKCPPGDQHTGKVTSVTAAGHVYQESAERELSHVKKAKPSGRHRRNRELRKVARRSRCRSECLGQRPRSVPRDMRFITVRQVPTGIFMGRGGSEEFTA